MRRLFWALLVGLMLLLLGCQGSNLPRKVPGGQDETTQPNGAVGGGAAQPLVPPPPPAGI
ncbi:MAG: hypothetical protein NZ959_12330 [Armatimonadetes bacterium]|nr:hypothetical protein [Armatimonadota bacterium]MDW8123086.1 hypothetical protein [Armatimonadota bacterium]